MEKQNLSNANALELTQGYSKLNLLSKLRADRAKLHERRAELRSTVGASSPLLDGMPKANGGVNRKTEKTAIMIANLDAAIQQKNIEIIRAECELQRIISSVPNSRLRLILRHRFIDGLAWENAARMISPTETAAAVRATFRRFMAVQTQNPT